MVQQHNISPVSLNEGKAFIDGIEVMDAVKCDIKFTPKVWTGKQIGEQTSSRRWLGYEITGNITRRRTKPWLKEFVERYKEKKRTPELTIQFVMNDENSDYYDQFGSDTVTAVGCVLTGDISLIVLDSGGEILDDNIAFGAKDIV